MSHLPGMCCQFPGCTLEYNHLGAHNVHSGVAHRYGLPAIPARIDPRIQPVQVQQVVIYRCHAAGCQENHRHHHCKNCGDRDADHRSGNCPRLQFLAPRGVMRGPQPVFLPQPPGFLAPHQVFLPQPPFGPVIQFRPF